jgi:hypothetical protein
MRDNFNFIDFYIGYPGHPRFRTAEIIEDDVVRVIVQKYEMIIFTNKGDLLCDTNFGADLVKLLQETRLSAESIEGEIVSQVVEYIPELEGVEYKVEVAFYEDPNRHQEYMEIYFELAGYEVYASVI